MQEKNQLHTVYVQIIKQALSYNSILPISFSFLTSIFISFLYLCLPMSATLIFLSACQFFPAPERFMHLKFQHHHSRPLGINITHSIYGLLPTEFHTSAAFSLQILPYPLSSFPLCKPTTGMKPLGSGDFVLSQLWLAAIIQQASNEPSQWETIQAKCVLG